MFKMSINREWHQKHKMKKNATEKEKIKWHIEHEKNCSCRKMPESIKKKIRKNEFQSKE
jgi:hypothetical protein